MSKSILNLIPGGTTKSRSLIQAGLPQQQTLMNTPFKQFGSSSGSLSYTPSWDNEMPGLNSLLGQTGTTTETNINNIADFGIDAFGENGGFGLGDMTMNGVLGLGSTLLNAYGMIQQMGLQKDMFDLYKEQLGMAKEQWQMTKDDVNRINKTRNVLNSNYRNAGTTPVPESKTDYA